jgi:hypothetical protein
LLVCSRQIALCQSPSVSQRHMQKWPIFKESAARVCHITRRKSRKAKWSRAIHHHLESECDDDDQHKASSSDFSLRRRRMGLTPTIITTCLVKTQTAQNARRNRIKKSLRSFKNRLASHSIKSHSWAGSEHFARASDHSSSGILLLGFSFGP